MGEADSIVSQLLVTHLLYTVQDLLAQQDSPVLQNSFSPFFSGPGLGIPDQD